MTTMLNIWAVMKAQNVRRFSFEKISRKRVSRPMQTNAILKSVLLNILAEVRAGAASLPAKNRLKRSDTATKPTTNFGKRSQITRTLGRWRFTAGLRFDFEHARLRYRNYTDTWYTKTRIKDDAVYELQLEIDDRSTLKQTFTELLPKFSVMYSFDETRNLYLTMQLMELDTPMVLALNMMDEVRANGGSILVNELEEILGIPVVPVSASRNEGIDELIDHAIHVARYREIPVRMDFCPESRDSKDKVGAVHRCIHAASLLLAPDIQAAGLPVRFSTTKLVENDALIEEKVRIPEEKKQAFDQLVNIMEQETGMDREAALANMRFTFLENLCLKTVVRPHESREHKRSMQIDRLLTGKYTAIPCFIGIMAIVFVMTFSLIGAWLSDLMGMGVDIVIGWISQALQYLEVNPVVQSLVVDGVCAGVGSVLSFLPTIVTLFFFLSILEDTGYMARVAFVMDRPLRKLGLSGRSFVPMLVGFGCSVPAIMATRTLSSERDRKMTILLTPFMSCSAKLPIYTLMIGAFFPAEYRALAMIGLYVFGILCGILYALLLKITKFRGEPVPFVMELPNYRLPSAKSVGQLIWEKAKDFIQKAFTVIFAASIVVWILQTFDARFNIVDSPEDSLLAMLGGFVAPIFAPLGFGDWRASTALLTGFTAKESVVSTLTLLLGGDTSRISSLFTPFTAVVFLVFVLLYTPCVAAIATVKRELGSTRAAAATVLIQCAIAWVMAFLVHCVGVLFGLA